MDVELIQKINNLALDLMKQGLAKDREDAVNQAEKMMKSNDFSDYSELRKTSDQIIADKQAFPIKQEGVAEELNHNQVSKILEQNTKFLVKTIKDFHEKIQYLEKEMSDLKNKVAYNKLPTVNDVRVSKVNEQSNESQSIKTEEKPKQNHPRVGKFEESDVSIEKFFYMGNGK